MTVVRPQLSVFQQFRAVPSELTDPLRAFLFGPEYDLHQYTAGGSDNVAAGDYDYLIGNAFEWLGDLERRVGATVDQSYTRVYLEDGLLRYWSAEAGPQNSSNNSSYNDPDAITANTPVGVRHKVSFNVNLVDKAGYALDADFYDRDVQVGDYAKVRAVVDGDTVEGEGTITAIEAEETAPALGSITAADANAATQGSAGPTVDQTDVTGSVTISAGGTYDGLAIGVLTETYTVTVVRGTTGQNPSTAILNVTSASGEDDVPGYVPTATAYGDPFDIGTRGTTVEITGAGNLNAGDVFTVTVAMAYTAPASLSAAGTYEGREDTTYIVTVTRGGSTDAVSDSDKPLVTVSTTTGYDSFPAQLVDDATNQITLGTYGVTFKFGNNATGVDLVAGDQFYLPVSAEGEGALRTIVLDRVLPAAMMSTEDVTIDLSVELCIKADFELHRQVNDGGVTTNWAQDEDEITVNAAAREFYDGWRDGEYSLPVVGGEIFVHWRELLADHTDTVYSITTLAELTEEFDTPIDPDNPLVYAASKALANSGSDVTPGTGLRLMAVPSDDAEGYASVLESASAREDIYALVPLTQSTEVHDLVTAHVLSMSSPDVGQWRICVLSVEETNPAPVVVENDSGTTLLATTDSEGTLIATDVDFTEAGVAAGDVVRLNYASDKYLETTYDTHEVDQVLSSTSLELATAPDPALGTPSKIEIWRDMEAADFLDNVGGLVQALNGGTAHRRVFVVYPSRIESGGEEVPGYFLASAIGGLIGSSAPQQGLTNVAVNGFDNADQVTDRYSRSQLDELANKGLMIVSADLRTGSLFVRHQLSTDLTDLNTRELSVVKNVDSIASLFRNRLRRFIGRANVTPSAIEVIRTELEGAIAYLKTASFNPLTGGQVLDGTRIRELRPHDTLRDRLVVVIDLVIPYPMNNIDLTLVI